MSQNEPTIDSQDTLLTEAAAWRVRLTEAGVASTPEFEAWLRDPAHAEAWSAIAEPWNFLGEAADVPELGMELQRARTHAWHARAQRLSHRLSSRIAAAVAVGFLIALTGWGVAWWLDRPDTYVAGIGERRVITLADGSHLSLDANSEVTVKYTKTARELRLKRGQARFDVVHDVERPFSVVAGDRRVIATGTAFNVELSGPKLLVTLIEGHVVVVDDSPPDSDLPAHQMTAHRRKFELSAGQQLAVAPQKPVKIVTANLRGVTAWMNGQIVFDNEPLSSVIERVNHYTTTPIVIRDPRVADMRLSGLVNTGDVGGFIDTVTQYLPLRAVASARTIELRPIQSL